MFYFNDKSNFVGFSQNTEWLPKNFDKFTSKNNLRKLFLSLSNNVLAPFCYFNKREIKLLCKVSLKEAFEYKIQALLPNTYVKPYKLAKKFTFDCESTKIILHYLNVSNKKKIFVANKNLLPAARLIAHCFIGNQMQLLLDKNLLFHEFVYQKVSFLHKNKEVLDEGDSITINSKQTTPTKIFTSWKEIDKNNLNIKNDVKKATQCVQDGQYNLVYLVYPKTDNFQRHIPVVVDVLEDMEYKIKVVPYSLRSTLR